MPTIPDPTVHSTPKPKNPGYGTTVGFPATVGAARSNPQAATERRHPQFNVLSKQEDEYGAMVDPFLMDDPGFPARWRMPPGQILQTMYRSQELGKMWKYADQIAVFEGSIQQYVRWAPYIL